MSTISFTDIKVLDGVCPAIAVLFTVARLALRIQSATVWWDDALAFLSSIFLVLTSAATGIHYGAPYSYTLATRLGAYYLIAEGFYATLWTARLSILFSIIRITPPGAQRRALHHAALAFAGVFLFLFAQVFWVCEGLVSPRWKARPNPQCPLGRQVAVCQLITDVASDALLVAAPVRLLARTNLEPALKVRLVSIFGAAVLTTVVSLVHAAYILEAKGIDAIISAIVEISVAIIVCNLIVVVPALFRACTCRCARRARGQEAHIRLPHEPAFRTSSFRFAISALASRFGRSGAGGAGTATSSTARTTTTTTGSTATSAAAHLCSGGGDAAGTSLFGASTTTAAALGAASKERVAAAVADHLLRGDKEAAAAAAGGEDAGMEVLQEKCLDGEEEEEEEEEEARLEIHVQK